MKPVEAPLAATSALRTRVAVDARDLLVTHRTGVERVVHHFIEEIGRYADWDVVLLFDRAPPGTLACAHRHETVVVPRRYGRLQSLLDAWTLLQLPPVLRARRIDAYLSLNTKFPATSRIPAFTTVHGLEWRCYPQGYTRRERLKQLAWFWLAAHFSAGIVTFANNTRHDILRAAPRTRVPVCTVPEGSDPIFRRLPPHELDRDLAQRHGLCGPYILSVCSLVPRKNVDGLMRAYARLVHDRNLAHDLALVGKSGWKAEALHALARELDIAGRVRFLGFVSDEALVQFYNQAALFVYPSKYEGFGLPLLEAMRCGVPVVTADRSATREVAGEAAVLVDPDSAGDIAAGMARALFDETLRARLINAGYARAAQHTWADMARGIHDFVSLRLARRPVR